MYRAFQPSVQRHVAVKVIKPELANNPEFIRRFEIEAQLVARLEHLHIVPLYDYWRDAGGAYLVMRLLTGGNLKEAMAEGPFTVAQTAKIVQEIGSALAVAHRNGVVHRDLKPANVLLDEAGNAYLSDFGIAKDVGADTEVTRTGQVIGSPAYMAPEQLRAETPTPQTDIYPLGLLVYSMLAGSHPFDTDSLVRLIDDQMTTPLPLLEGAIGDVPAGIDHVLARATEKPPAQRFPDVTAFLDAFAEVVGTVTRAEPVVAIAAPNPYKGLRAFQETDAADFFGREALVDRLVSHLGGERFLAVVGPSGSGKSSVVRAGLIPALRRDAVPGSGKWLVADLIPGTRPFEELEATLLRVAVNPPPTLLEQLRRDEGGLRSAVKRILPAGTEMLLVIDQFEELFTLGTGADRDLFIAGLLGAIEDDRTPLRVIVTLRADFYDRPLQYEALGELMRTRTETVLPLGRAGIEAAVTGPAQRVGVPVDADLIPEIAADLAGEPGALPLLQYALTQVFEARQGRSLSVETYRDVGGISGALAQRAEELYAELDPQSQDAARQVFLRLVTLGEGTGDTRRRVPMPEIETLGDVGDVLDAFGNARLLSFDRDPASRTPTVEVGHEALLTEWDRLRAWIDDSRDDLRTHRRLRATATEWTHSGHDPSFLFTGSRLDQFSEWADATSLTIGGDERDLLAASIEQADEVERAETARAAQELALERRSARRLRILVGVMATAAVTAIALTGFALAQRSTAREQARIAEQQATIAEQQADIAEEQTAIAEEQTAEADAARREAEADRAEAQRQRAIAEREAVIASTRELIAQSAANRSADPQLSLLLALAATGSERHVDGAPLPEAAAALWDATQQIKIAQPILSVASRGQEISTQVTVIPILSDGPSYPFWNTLGGFGFNFYGAFSPDGRLLAVVEKEGVVRVWDTDGGGAVGSVTVDAEKATAIAFSPDGSLIAVAGATIQLVDTSTMDIVRALQPSMPTGVVRTIDFSHDGTRLVAATGEAAEVFDVATGAPLGDPCCPGPIAAAFYIGQTQFIATAGESGGEVTVWDPDLGVEEHRTGTGEILYQVSTDGTRIATVEGGRQHCIFDLLLDSTLHCVRRGDPDDLATAAFALLYSPRLDQLVTADPIGSRLSGTGASASSTNFTVIDVATRRTVASIGVEGTPFPSFDATLDRLTLTDLVNGRVRVLDARAGADAVRIPVELDSVGGGTVGGGTVPANWFHATSRLFLAGGASRAEAYFDPTGARLVTCCSDEQATLWDLDARRGAALTGFTLEAAVTDLTTLPDRQILVGTTSGGSLRSTSGAEAVVELAGIVGPAEAVAATDNRLAAAGATVPVWTSEGELLTEITGLTTPTGVVWHPDGRRLAAAESRRITIWDTESPDEPLMEFLASSAAAESATIGPAVKDLAFTRDGALLLTSGTGGAIEGWLVADGTQQLLVFLGFNRNALALAVHASDEQVATVNNDGSVMVIDLPTQDVVVEATAHLLPGTSIAYSPDGALLASGSLDRTVAVLDAETLQEQFIIESDAPVTAVAFSADGSELVVGDTSGRVSVYPVSFARLLEQAESLITRELTAEECRRYFPDGCPG